MLLDLLTQKEIVAVVQFQKPLRKAGIEAKCRVSRLFSGPAASSRLRLFEVMPCHVMLLCEKRILCYDMAG